MTRLSRLALLFLLALGSSPDPALARPVDSCGWVVTEAGCLRFRDLAEPGDYVLPDSLAPVEPGIYHVTAESYTTDAVCGDHFYSSRLRNVEIEACIPDTFGCGRIEHYSEEYECDVWVAIAGGQSFLVGDLQGYAVGDTVVAVGIRCGTCAPVPGTCADYGDFLEAMELLTCSGSPNPVTPTTWGRVKARYR